MATSTIAEASQDHSVEKQNNEMSDSELLEGQYPKPTWNWVVSQTYVRDGSKSTKLTEEWIASMVKLADDAQIQAKDAYWYMKQKGALGLDDADREIIRRWFGEDAAVTPKTFKKVKAVAKLIWHVLGQLKLMIVQGQRLFECDSPGSIAELPNFFWRNMTLRFNVWICPEFFNGNDRPEQIRILTHEASHHIGTRDYGEDGIPASGSTLNYMMGKLSAAPRVYGEEACEELARAHPDVARKSADNFAFFMHYMHIKLHGEQALGDAIPRPWR